MERLTVITELTQGRELANELKNQLHPINTPRETCNFLLEKILSSYDNALALLALIENGEPSCNSTRGSPRRKGSDPDSEDPAHNHVANKRKLLPKWSEQVRVCSRTGLDQLGDGYNWRKYGQKAILGANNPRSYYRCTHRPTQGCLATKQVQRSDEDSSIFDIVYQGKHTCFQERSKRNKENCDVPKKEEVVMISNEPCLEVENQELGSKEENVPSFSFPSTPIKSEITETTRFFSNPTNFGETSYLPQFPSPATSDSYFSASPCQVNDFEFAPNFQNVPEFDFAEIMSNPTRFTDFPLEDVDLSIDQVGFDSDHFVEDFEYFS